MFIKSPKQVILNCYLRGSNKITLTNYKNKIKNLLINNKYKYTIATLPTTRKRYYILRSPHVYKKSIETFEEQIYYATFRIISNSKTQYVYLFHLMKFLKYNVPLNINITFKIQNNVQTTIL